MRQPTLFEGTKRLVYDEAIDLTLQSLQAYGPAHDHWAIAWSGGKDSTALLTLIIHLIEVGRIAAPKTLTIFYADTRQELLPLAIAAQRITAQLAARGIAVEIVMAPLDKRFLVYILGRGVPPPNNNTLRWCTRQIKIDPMADALEARLSALDGNVLMLTGVRQGESAIRDQRIVMSCGKDGAECGQGWYQQVLPNAKGIRGRIATLAPLLHWRVCNIWDWLRVFAPMREYGGWSTALIADVYGGDEAEERNARTGCTGCPLTDKDLALDNLIAMPDWAYLAPLKGLKPLYRELRLPRNRIRKTGLEFRKDGTPAANPQRMGPLTFEARLMGLDRVLVIQGQVNEAARSLGRPEIDLLNAEEEARIRELIAAQTWPHGWDGDEPTADTPLDTVFRDGSIQPLLV
ncbi:phosphoadenosine phosphosulfate reductase family protein [Mesorhizobium captivum]|uniref:phosphoadenosine phosphosulfate reductase domain-containing protein n=1 Tax=Mesorhizobium captivum TaxID=3072319 RepID=UPI002A23C83C|nr:phosphoadenosine phosphosulfate reductase family protein [Mesorhizobium sp. VK23E]MDX8513547.1 phosphoadenosine phosphosulfate reductase family protein [Mesorhizobium sp. VK23E]